MKCTLPILAASLLCAQDAAPAAGDAPDLAEGLARIEERTAAGELERATALVDELLAPTAFERWRASLEAEGSRVLAGAVDLCAPAVERLGLGALPEPVRGELFYARGLVRLEAEDAPGALRGFDLARSLGGPGGLRLDATYDLGVTAFLEGEEWRGLLLDQPAGRPGLIGAAPAPDGEQPDPLAEARAAYLRAREHLVERLRADWRDANTRANVELVQRRLRWLDEEQERQQEQQEQDEQDSEEDSSDAQPEGEQEGDPSEDGEQSAEEGDGEENEEGEQEQEGEERPDEDRSADDGESSEDAQGDGEEAGTAEPQEVYLTREEVQRMLEKLAEHEEQGEEVKARLYRNRRQRVERDW
ncbi:MAG: hypothetical protein QF903_15085 [Planctomycetota bacterium]|jgi:hypothetical protein|nr:hypothetical protein [Planctomycetota bacterium]MDP6990795.1 hypothetical protein [Planctomycetota bacterium]